MIKRLILFDIDGTLLISKGLGRESKRLAMIDIFGTDGDVMTHPFGGKTDWQILVETLDKHGITPEEIEERMDDYLVTMARHMAEIADQFEHQVLPGAMELVTHFHEDDETMIGVVTGNNQQTAPIKLQSAGFDPEWFVVGAFGNESTNRDDLPRLALERANQKLDMPLAGKDVIVIGDTVMDVQCSQAVGGMAVAVLTGFEDPELLKASKPDYLLPDLTAFFETVKLP